MSGTSFARPNFNALVKRIRRGNLRADTFIFHAPDRFARDLLEAIKEEKRLRENLGIHPKFSDEWYADIDTTTEIGRIRLYKAFLEAQRREGEVGSPNRVRTRGGEGSGDPPGSLPSALLQG